MCVLSKVFLELYLIWYSSFLFAGGQGLEPRFSGPKPDVTTIRRSPNRLFLYHTSLSF
jgi:hypothetical protein